MRKSGWKRCLAGACALVLAGTLVVTAVPANAAKKKKAEVDLDGTTYHATLGVQTCTQLWITRMGYYAADQNEMYGTENANKMFYKESGTGNVVVQNGVFVDAEIAGNGTYTVALQDADFAGEKDISQLHIATDIPVNDTIQFSAVKVKINGREITSFDEGFMEDEEPYLTGGMVCLCMNHWRSGLVSQLADQGMSETAESGYSLLNGDGADNIEITFTVSGFNYDNETILEEQEADNQPADEQETDTSDVSPANESTGNPSLALVCVIVAAVVVAVIVVVVLNRKKKDKK